MGKTQVILILVGALVVFGLIVFGLYLLGGEDQSALERFRDITIVLIGLTTLLITTLMVAITALLVWLVFTIKEKIVPALDTLNETMHRVKGTTEFLTEEVASPVISVYGNVARARAMVRTVTGKDREPAKSGARLLKR